MTLNNIIRFFLYGLIIGLAMYHYKSHAGPYLDLAVGTPFGNYNSSSCINDGASSVVIRPDSITVNCQDGTWIGDSGMLGKVAVGYISDGSLKLWKLNIHGYGEVEHISDPRMGDGGINAGWIGVRIQ